uniref:Uncharacterized protein n=1 Tax=Geospiza parvula TaxID=87175 RepID=A0A8C3M4N6_GEOPR
MATYSPVHGLRLIGSFQKVSLTRATPKASAITLQNLILEDDSYYRCIFKNFYLTNCPFDWTVYDRNINQLTL